MTQYHIFTISAFIIILLLALCLQNISIESKASAQLPVPNVTSNTSRIVNPSAVTTNNNAIITIHTTNSIQGNNLNVIKQELPGIRKTILMIMQYL
jgi:hypothetical protein